MSNTVYLIIFLILMVPGLIGILIPIFPGIPFMFIVALVYGLLDRFNHLAGLDVLVLGFIALVSILVDYFSGVLGAKFSGASRRASLWGLIGLILGIIILPPFGGILGLLLGVFASEYLLHKDHKRATKAATGSLIGQLTGILINLILAILFITLFIIMVLR